MMTSNNNSRFGVILYPFKEFLDTSGPLLRVVGLFSPTWVCWPESKAKLKLGRLTSEQQMIVEHTIIQSASPEVCKGQSSVANYA